MAALIISNAIIIGVETDYNSKNLYADRPLFFDVTDTIFTVPQRGVDEYEVTKMQAETVASEPETAVS